MGWVDRRADRGSGSDALRARVHERGVESGDGPGGSAGRPRERLAGPCSGVYPPARWLPAPGLRLAVPFCNVVGAHPEGAGADSRNADWPAPSSRRVPRPLARSSSSHLPRSRPADAPNPVATLHSTPWREEKKPASTRAAKTRGTRPGHHQSVRDQRSILELFGFSCSPPDRGGRPVGRLLACRDPKDGVISYVRTR